MYTCTYLRSHTRFLFSVLALCTCGMACVQMHEHENLCVYAFACTHRSCTSIHKCPSMYMHALSLHSACVTRVCVQLYACVCYLVCAHQSTPPIVCVVPRTFILQLQVLLRSYSRMKIMLLVIPAACFPFWHYPKCLY